MHSVFFIAENGLDVDFLDSFTKFLQAQNVKLKPLKDGVKISIRKEEGWE